MAGDAKHDEVEDGTAAVEMTDGCDWTCRLLSLERVLADEIDDDGQDVFAAKFQVDGPDANAEVEIIVSDVEDEAQVVAIALHTLHVAMRNWGRITENRRIAARDVDEVAGERAPARDAPGHATGS